MLIKFNSRLGNGVISINNGEITVDMNKDTDLYRRITLELEKGIVDLKEFKNKGIPGKFKYTKQCRNHDDIVKLLRSLKKEFYIDSIVTIERDDNNPKIIDIDELKMKKLIDADRCVREFDDRYEYCYIKEYEEIYDDFECDSIQFDDVFVQLLTVEDKRFIVSIDFPKNKFDLRSIIYWLDMNDVKIANDNYDYITNASSVIKGLLFKGTSIILYKKGNENIYLNRDNLREVIKEFIPSSQRIDTHNSKERNSIRKGMEIIFNGEKISYIPEIDIDLTKDLLISNGHIFVANYLGDYGGCIGFFEEKDDDPPLAWIYDTDTKVYIDIYENMDQKIIFVEHGYSIDINTLWCK